MDLFELFACYKDSVNDQSNLVQFIEKMHGIDQHMKLSNVLGLLF